MKLILDHPRGRYLQDIIDRIAHAAGTFPLPHDGGVYEIVVLDGDEFQAMRGAIQNIRDILSENGDWQGDYPEELRS